MDEALEQFLIEGRELVQQASDGLLALERSPADATRIDGALRAVHTLKGSAAVFGFAPMGQALHAAEDLLEAVRAGRLAAGRAVVDVLLDCIGASDEWIEAVARTEQLPPTAAARSLGLTMTLRALTMPGGVRAGAVLPEHDWVPALLSHAAGNTGRDRAATALRYLPKNDCFFLGDDPLALVRSVPQLVALRIGERAPWPAEDFDPFACNLVIEALSAAPVDEVRAIFRLVGDQAAIVAVDGVARNGGPVEPAIADADGNAGTRMLRVDAGRVDSLADIVGELIVAKNRLAHLAARAAEIDPRFGRELAANQSAIERLTGDMHRAVTGIRSTPLSRTFRRFPRLVREIAGRLGKEVELEIFGGEVEADKSVTDGLFEPLLHVLRNAIDHGLEASDARRVADKPATGRVTVRARRDGDQVVITVSDDGRGLDAAAIRRTAKERGLVTDAAADALDPDAVLDLIFAPGLSTATVVTEISGRGVGMDAVRTAATALGGRVAVASSPGTGTTVRLTLPQTVAVTTVMTIRLGNERFGVPIDAVVETARIPAERILPIRSGSAFVLRDRTIPLLRLADLLALPATPRSATGARVLIVACGEQRVGVEVDGFAERIDVLLRPLTGLLSGLPGMRGAALLGDGCVLMVLDLAELIG